MTEYIISPLHKCRQILGGLVLLVSLSAPSRADAAGAPIKPKIAMLIADEHYQTEESLPVFAKNILEPHFRVVRVQGSSSTLNPKGERSVKFDRIEEINDAQLMLVSATRRTPEKSQLAAIRKYVASGKPIVGIRTANHAFIISPGNTNAPWSQEWREWDAEVIGGNYTGHHKKGAPVNVTAPDASHPILKGVTLPIIFKNTLYKVSPLQPGAKTLLVGELPGQPPEPMAWLFERRDGGRTFYIAMGGLDDFANPAFTKCVFNAIDWLVKNPRGK